MEEKGKVKTIEKESRVSYDGCNSNSGKNVKILIGVFFGSDIDWGSLWVIDR